MSGGRRTLRALNAPQQVTIAVTDAIGELRTGERVMTPTDRFHAVAQQFGGRSRACAGPFGQTVTSL